MRNILSIITLLAVIAACKPEIKPIGEAYKAGEGIPGSWEMVGVTSIDIVLPVPEERDQSAILNDVNNRMIITINEGGDYTVDQQGVAPAIFGADGTWMYDKVDFPTMLYLIPTSGDTLKASLLNMPRKTDNSFGVSLTRNRCDKDYVTMQYTFNRK